MDTRSIPKEEVNGDAALVDIDVCPLAAETPRMTGAENEDARPTCPRDGVPLDLDFTQKGAVLYRCDTCDGAFVSRPQAEQAIAMYKERNKRSS